MNDLVDNKRFGRSALDCFEELLDCVFIDGRRCSFTFGALFPILLPALGGRGVVFGVEDSGAANVFFTRDRIEVTRV